MNDRLRVQRDAIALGGFAIDLKRGDLFDANGQRVPLRRQSLAVLLELAHNAGLVLTRKALEQAVWKGALVTDDSLVQCVVEIRRALGPTAAAALKTVPRRGYLLQPDGVSAASDPAPAPSSDLAEALSPIGPPGLPFVGRQAELDSLVTGSCRPAAAGCLVLISGEPGIGKSRLIEEAARVASTRGAVALVLKCHEIESGVAYGALSQLIDRLVALAEHTALQALDGTSRAELASLVPWCAARLEPLAPLAETDAALRHARLRAAMVALCAAAGGRRRLILCIDDAHWLDAASAVTLFAVAEAASRHPYSLWATLRSDEVAGNPNAVRLVHSLLELQHTSKLALSRLKPEDVAHIVAQVQSAPRESQLAPPSGQVDWLVRESAGNPFYLRELLQADRGNAPAPTQAGREEGSARILPASILDAVLHRARHLAPAARRLLEGAAVLEQGAVFEVLCGVARQERPVALEALEALMSSGWLLEDRERGRYPAYPFVHDKLREAIYASLSAALCRTLHGRAARALLNEAAQRKTAPEHAVVAAHAQRAGQDALAAEQFALAADAARRMFELRRAEALYTQALHFEPEARNDGAASERMALLEKRGAVRSMLGAAAEAEMDLRNAIEIARDTQAQATATGSAAQAHSALVRLHIELGVVLQRHNRLEEALGALGRALDLATAAQDEAAIAAARSWLGDVEWMRERNRAARVHFEAVLGVRSTGEPARHAVEAWRTKALFGLAQCASMDARPASADKLLDQALAGARTPAEQFFECAWGVLKGWIRVGGHGMAEPDAAREYFERCLSLSRQADLFWYFVPCEIGIGVVHAMHRRFDTAIEHFDSVLSRPADANSGRWRLAAGVWLAWCHLQRGAPAAALETARQAQRALGEFGAFMFAAKLPALIAMALVRLGRWQEVPDPQALVEQARRDEVGYVVVAALEARAEWLHARGDAAELATCVEEMLSEAIDRGLPQVRAVAVYWRARARVLSETGPGRADAPGEHLTALPHLNQGTSDASSP